MSVKELLVKTGLFILAPAFLVYSCLRLNEDVVLQRAADRLCIRSISSPSLTSLTVVGQADDGRLIYKSTSDTSTLQQLRKLAKKLSPIRVKPGDYRPSVRHYTLLLVKGTDTCQMVLYKMPAGQADLLNGVQDTAYKAPQLTSFLDSVFRYLASNSRENDRPIKHWLSK
ncbi:hypothetical protein [Hymenobacter sp. 102]|uniref:hypothetical protein n=1 Tax=Hymenobacter sp. 102 TaxID=3403152 RepID=UPI003CF6920C